MAYALGNKYANNLCKRTVLLQLSSKMWSHVFWNTVYMHITEVVKHIMSVMMLPVAGLTS